MKLLLLSLLILVLVLTATAIQASQKALYTKASRYITISHDQAVFLTHSGPAKVAHCQLYEKAVVCDGEKLRGDMG